MDMQEKTVEELKSSIDQEKMDKQQASEQKKTIVWIVIALVVLVVITIASLIYLLNAPAGTVSRIRDIFIIFVAIQSLLTGLVLVILIVQLSRLINLLQNEIKPILDSTNETVSTLRGTSAFLSENLVEPVIKLNEYFASFLQALAILGLTRRKPKN